MLDDGRPAGVDADSRSPERLEAERRQSGGEDEAKEEVSIGTQRVYYRTADAEMQVKHTIAVRR